MTKRELVQLTMDSAGVEFGKRTAELHLSNVFNSFAGQLFSRDSSQFEFYTKRLTLTVTERVAMLTVPVIQTASVGNGVIRCMPTGADCACYPDGTIFYPAPAYAIRSTVDANSLPFVFYSVTGSTVRFNNQLPRTVTEVLADIVPEFSGYDDDDFIQLPMGMAQLIIDAAVASLKGQESHQSLYKKKS